MLRQIIGAAVLVVVVVGITFADEFRAVITKVEGDKVTFNEFKGKSKGAEHTMPVADKVKVVKGKFNKETKTVEAGDEIDEGLKNPMFTKIGEKGIPGMIITDADKKITEIRVLRKGRAKE
jgi:hypothetical protein